MNNLFYILLLLLGAVSLSAQDMIRFQKLAPGEGMIVENCMREAMELMEGKTPTVHELPALRQHGKQLLQLGQREYAKEIFEQVRNIARDAYGTDDPRYLSAMEDLASAYVLLVRYNEAKGIYEELVAKTKALEGRTSRAYLHALNEAGYCYTRLQQWQVGTKIYDEALEIAQEMGLEGTETHAILLNNRGACYKNTGDLAAAIDHYQRAMQLAKGNTLLLLNMAPNLAEAQAMAGAPNLALLQQYEPIALKQLSGPSIGTARVWMQYGVAYLYSGDLEKAERCFGRALAANSLTFDEINKVADHAENLMHGNDFLAVCTQAGNMAYVIEVYKARYDATGELVHLKDGYRLIQSMMAFGDELMSSYLSEENKLILYRLGAAILFDRGLYFAHELHRHTGEQRYLEEAFFYAERSKSTLLTHALRSKDQQTLVDLPPEALAQNKAYVKQLKDLQKHKIETLDREKRQEIQQQINELNIEIERFKDKLKREYPAYYQHRYSNHLNTLAEVQKYLAETDQVLLEYALGVQYNYAFVVHKDRIQMLPLEFDPTELKEKATEFREVLTNYKRIVDPQYSSRIQKNYLASSSYLYDRFVQPLISDIPKETALIVVPDRVLGHLPFEAFLTGTPQKLDDYSSYPYLLRDYPISYSYSATILLNQIQRQERRQVPEKGILAFAASYPDQLDPNSISYQRGGNLGRLREGLSPLPGAEEEVVLLEKHLWGAFYNGETANETNFKEKAGKYSIIHLAMHGVLNNDYPILSSLVFSEDSSEVEDNFLRAYEIAQLDLNADLVVLSACETGYGKFQQGEGVMSLAHSFAYAGASSVLMSLWQVNDHSTSEIMKEYYVHLAKAYNKDIALQHAKLHYIDHNPKTVLAHPAFWAAFVQTGNTASLELVAHTGKTFRQMHYLMIGSAILLVLLIILGIKHFKNKKRQNS